MTRRIVVLLVWGAAGAGLSACGMEKGGPSDSGAGDTDGLWAVHEHAEWTRTTGDGVVSTGWTDRVFEHALLAPAVVEVGVSWSETSTTSTTEEVDGVAQEPVVEENAGTFTVTLATTVTVTGGTFDVLQVDGTVRGNATTFYLADGIGAVKNGGGELAAYTG